MLWSAAYPIHHACSLRRHFTIRGAEDTDFAGGMYHGRILLPPDYPFKPPHIVFLTPSGRFETNTKICLSFSAYHPELWQPAWGIRLILEALISFLPTPADGAIGALDWSSQERRKLAVKSQTWECPCCGPIKNLLPKPKVGVEDKPSRFQKEIEQLQKLQATQHQKEEEEAAEGADAAETTEKESPGNGQSAATPKEEEEEEEEEEPLLAVEEEGPSSATEEGTPREEPAPAASTPQSPQPVVEEDVPLVHEEEPVGEDPATTPLVEDSAWIMDPILQGIIVILSVICYLLAKKCHALWEDLQALER